MRCVFSLAHCAIDFQADIPPARLDARTRLGELAETLWAELLSAEPRIHRHHQNGVDLVDDVIEPVERCGGIEHQARRAAGIADVLDGAVHMQRRFRVKADARGARVRKIRGQRIDRGDHQVHVDGRGDARLAQRLAHHGPDGEIGHVVIVHHVEMNPIRARGDHGLHLLPEAGKIG